MVPHVWLSKCLSRSVPSKLPQSGSTENKLFSTNMPPLTHGPERDILTHILTSLLRYTPPHQVIYLLRRTKYLTKHDFFHRSLLDDLEFHQQLQNTLIEPAPYFTQLRPASPLQPTTPSETPYADDIDCFTESRPSTHHTESTNTVAQTHTRSGGECEPQPCQELNPTIREQVQESIRKWVVLKTFTVIFAHILSLCLLSILSWPTNCCLPSTFIIMWCIV